MAEFNVVSEGQVQSFKPIDLDFLSKNENAIQFGFRTVPFANWDGFERKVLNTYPEYQEPTIPKTKGGVTENEYVTLTMFIARAVFLIKKPSVSLSNIQQIDSPLLVENVISPSELVTNKQDNMEFRNPRSDKKWCMTGKGDSSRVYCLHTKFDLGKFAGIFATYATHIEGSQFTTLEGEGDLRLKYELSKQEAADLVGLTGIRSLPKEILEKNIVWITHGVQFIKVVVIPQVNPKDPNQNIITAYAAIAVQKKTFDKGIPGTKVTLKDFFLRDKDKNGCGILDGLPCLTKDIIRNFADRLSN